MAATVEVVGASEAEASLSKNGEPDAPKPCAGSSARASSQTVRALPPAPVHAGATRGSC
jgi:hypothetical protein